MHCDVSNIYTAVHSPTLRYVAGVLPSNS